MWPFKYSIFQKALIRAVRIFLIRGTAKISFQDVCKQSSQVTSLTRLREDNAVWWQGKLLIFPQDPLKC